MEFPEASAPGQEAGPKSAADARLQPAPDYGTLGPGSDIVSSNSDGRAPSQALARNGSPSPRAKAFVLILAVVLGAVVAGLTKRTSPSGRSQVRTIGTSQGDSPPAATAASVSPSQIERMKPQRQAEALLQLAVAHSDGAVDQISSRVDRWQGKLTWDSQMATLTTAALNSNDMHVRESGIEVELAAYGLAKNSKSLEYVLQTVESPDHAQKIWGLWALGLMGNRGVETARVLEVLSAHLKDSDEDSRHWAVEGLALAGSDAALPLLLTAMHDDPSPLVREEAACGIAQSGMFTREQRFSALPQLLNYTDDPALDARTRSWAFLALADITGQHLPNDPAAWRNWYEKTGARG